MGRRGRRGNLCHVPTTYMQILIFTLKNTSNSTFKIIHIALTFSPLSLYIHGYIHTHTGSSIFLL